MKKKKKKSGNVIKAVKNATDKIQKVYQTVHRNAAGITDSFRDKCMV